MEKSTENTAPVVTAPELVTKSGSLRSVGLWLFFILFVVVAGWLWIARIEGAVIGSGSVGVIGKPQTVQHLDGGIVSEILVDNGDEVTAGQLLLRLDETLLRSNLDIFSNRLREGISRRDRLLAESEDAPSIVWDDAIYARLNLVPDEEIRAGQERIWKTRRAAGSGQIAQLREQIQQFENQISGLDALKLSKNEQIRSLTGELENMRVLQADGYASDNRVLGLERQIEEYSGQIAGHDSEISRVRNSIAETRIQMLQIGREFDESVETELREVELSIKDLEQQFFATKQQLDRIDIRAPVDGVVHELGIFTIGGVVPPGGAVLKIIPQDQKMEFEVNIEPQYVDQVYPGQDVRVMFSAFNIRTTPELNGTVSRVSPSTIVNDETGLAFYLVNIELSDEEIERLNGQALVPGMPIDAFITTESRSPLNYLVKPLTDNFRKAMREQ